jgi:hypothetical protein
MVIKPMDTLRQIRDEAPPAPPKPSNEEKVLGEIRELFQKGRSAGPCAAATLSDEAQSGSMVTV